MTKAQYMVQVPIAGHIIVYVDAETEEEAISLAMESDDLNIDNLESWEALEQFNMGNVCYCPKPWSAEATREDEE